MNSLNNAFRFFRYSCKNSTAYRIRVELAIATVFSIAVFAIM